MTLTSDLINYAIFIPCVAFISHTMLRTAQSEFVPEYRDCVIGTVIGTVFAQSVGYMFNWVKRRTGGPPGPEQARAA
ncbi:uncharacterized protein N0V89_007887 [Didymosphaeria variabile]|uniref:Uncharacterized protein n=1 Tax=Didymosphaeria variabile TaxID=1932322 RepID=A0A9W9CAQ7_9PLEO|nr:uncharacterized protein N0V89_007887 [Didymosphaeria variabile]KAJ4352538.1 hypothetical protein N0V89_007887 [Didymosphaeria variabile]